MAFGLSFGKKKSSSSTKATLTKDETTNQQQQSDTQSTQNQSSTTSGTTQNQSQGTSTTSQENNQQTSSTTQQQQDQTSKAFSDAILGLLEQGIGGLSSGAFGGQDQVNESLGELGSFNADDFVANSMQAARATTQSQLDETLGGLMDMIGGGTSSNSAAALLASRVQGEANANLAGQQSQFERAAQDIAAQRVNTTSAAVQGQQGFFSTLLNALKGGQETTSGVTTGTTAGSTTGAQTGTTQTNESSLQQTNQQQNTITQLSQIINQLLQGTTNTVGTEDSTTKGKTGGGGFSLSI